MNYTIYNKTTGEIIRHITTADEQTLKANLENQDWITGSYSSTTHYVENKKPQLLPTKPTDSNEYVFDWNKRAWVADSTQMIISVRQHRNSLLASIDRINPIWYASLTTEQQNDLIQYRTALLNVPQQSGFPTMISWPMKPDWL